MPGKTEANFNSNHSSSLGHQVLIGSLATLTVVSGEKLMVRIAKHPFLVFGLGLVGGAYVYKNRKAIIANASKTIDAGKNVILEQKEKVRDLIAEATAES